MARKTISISVRGTPVTPKAVRAVAALRGYDDGGELVRAALDAFCGDQLAHQEAIFAAKREHKNDQMSADIIAHITTHPTT